MTEYGDVASDRLLNVHPGEVLRLEFMEPLGVSTRKLSTSIGVHVSRVSRIVEGKGRITVDTALRLARFFDVSPQFWLDLQHMYDVEVLEANPLARAEYELIEAYHRGDDEHTEGSIRKMKARV